MTGSGADLPRLSDDDAVRLRALFGDVFGWEMGPESKATLEGRLRRRITDLGLASYSEYLQRLTAGAKRGEELRVAADLLSTRETYFFREEYQLEAFQDEIVPEIVRARAASGAPNRLRIWSAGCASGEEPYTIAMLCLDHPLLAGWDVEICSSDIAPSAVAAVVRGEYDDAAVRKLPRPMLERHFTRTLDPRWRIGVGPRAIVRVDTSNLAAGEGPAGPFDVVFCRNVLIYFSLTAKRFLAQRFLEKLAPGGWLLLGHAESLATITDAFELVRVRNDVVYRRPALADFRVLIADDSAFARRILAKIVESQPGITLTGSVGDGLAALREVKRTEPHLLLLDLDMPELDGFGVLRGLAQLPSPPAVIVVSGQAKAENAVKSLELGAFDFVAKPSEGSDKELELVAEALIPRLEVLRMGRPRLRAMDPEGNATRRLRMEGMEAQEAAAARKFVLVGASTGGPGTLLDVLKSLPETFPAAVVVAVHMPAGFTAAFAERLSRRGRMPAAEAKAGEILREGRIVLCPGGHHVTLAVTPRGVVTNVTVAKDGESGWCPSVDRLFDSAIAVGAGTLGVVLTGMGTDGAKGALALKRAGGRVIVESPETAVVAGMPGAAIANGAADEILRREDIAQAVRRWAVLREL